MARLPRFFVKGVPLHVIQRGNNRDAIFVANGDYRFYLECLKQPTKRGRWEMTAFAPGSKNSLVAAPRRCGVRDQEAPERKSERMFKRTFLRV